MCRRRVVRVHVALELGEGGDIFCDARGSCYGNSACRLCVVVLACRLCAVVLGGRCWQKGGGRRRRRIQS